jgi:hypothetical protein
MYNRSEIEKRLKDLEKTVRCKTRFFDSFEDFPETGAECALYVDESTGDIYIWNGSVFIKNESSGGTDGVPYIGATGDVDLGEFGLKTGNLEFDTTPTGIPTAPGSVYWNDIEGTLSLVLEGGNVISNIGETQHIRAYNNSGGNITKGQVVYISGSQGQRLTVGLADADTEILSKDTFGFAAENINDGDEGFVIVQGVLKNINTNGFVDGNTVFLSSTPGGYTNTPPSDPSHLVVLGFIVKGNSGGAGSIYVKVDNGYEIEELHNVTALSKTTVVDNDAFLLRDSADNNLWKRLSWANLKTAIQGVTVSGTGAAGQVSYWTGSTTQSGSNNLFWDAVNNKLALGTTTTTSATRAIIQGTTASDTAQLGAELLTTGTGDASWTGSSFATGYTHVPGSTTTLTSTLAAVTNSYYQIEYTVTGRTAGSFTIDFGGITISSLSATGSRGPRATSTGTLVITPTSDFNGTIVLSIKINSVSIPTVSLLSSAGTVTNELRVSSLNSNTFTGFEAGTRNTSGANNSFIGSNSGRNNTTGSDNTFIGRLSGTAQTTANQNSFFGVQAGLSNTTGSTNTFIGINSGLNNTTGSNNSFLGSGSGSANTTGGANAFFGVNAGLSNTTGNNNTSVGLQAGFANTTGGNNVFFGFNAGRFITGGLTTNTVSSNSIFLGYDTRANASSETNQVVIGYQTTGLGSNTTIIGNTSTTQTHLYGDLTIGDTTKEATAIVDISSTTKGFLSPRMDSTQRNAISTPAAGLELYNTTSNKKDYYNGSSWVSPAHYISATATLTVAGWSLVGGVYEQDIANTNITANSLVNIIPDNADFQTVVDAEFLPANDSAAGSVKVYANNLPAANIGVTLIIFN